MTEDNATPTMSPPPLLPAPPSSSITSGSKIREEGELSASDNDNLAANLPFNKDTAANGPAARTSVQLNRRKATEKNRVPFVISFSDDDTSEEADDMTRVGKQTNTKSPKKIYRNRTFVNRFKNVGVGVKSHHNSPKFAQNVQLQDLRQLIAIRENEIKSKARPKLKSIVTSRNYSEPVAVEPEKKRLRVSEPPRNAVVSVIQPRVESASAAYSVGERDTAPSVAIPFVQHDRPPSESIVAAGTASSALENDGLRNPPLGIGIISNSMQQNMITNLGESSAQLMAKTDGNSSHRQGSLSNSSFWNHFGTVTGEMDAKSLFEIEELQDKELDEAQEHRRKCEIEERNALKAYRKAQRALAEANTRCSYLYHRRNLFPANLQPHVMEDPNMFWSNMPHQQNTEPNVNSDMLDHHQHTEPNVNSDLLDHQQHTEPNVNSDMLDHQVQNECGDPNTSGSESQEQEKSNDEGSSLHEDNIIENILAKDDQTLAGDSRINSQGSGRNNELNNNSVSIIDSNEDSLLLEQTLRSQLFARLGNRTLKQNETGQTMETAATAEREDGEILEDTGNKPSSETEYDLGDIVMSDKSIPEQPMSIKDQCDVDKYPVDCGSFLAEPILKSAFGHVKITAMASSMQSHTKITQIHTDDIVCARPTDLVSNSLLDLYVGEDGSYSNNLPINHFWPHCMFELRGKCNDDECPWQHVRDYSSKNIDSNCIDKGSFCLAPPTYLVCLDSLKADSHPYKYLVAQTIEQRWQKYFSASLVVSSSILGDLNSDELSLHGPETRIDVHGVWNRQSSYFHSHSVKEGLPDEQTDDIYQRLEMAFLNLSEEVSKKKGHRETLIVLARALEEHPTSVLLWIVYLHIYYSTQKSIGKDDLFCYAIEHNESSYELWLMFINSREKLDDRLLGYNTAISALCRHASTPNRDPEIDSECILDLFLQMINCLCSSGEVNNAIKKLYGLLSSAETSTDLYTQSLPSIQKFLTIPDRCVLWISSIYLLMYKKLPDTVIQQFECHKELPPIEWYSVHLSNDEKQQAITLIELASDYCNNKSYQSKRTAISTQRFALNLIRCTAVLEGFDSCKYLLKKYLQFYPSCLELVLLSIRVNAFNLTESTITAFDEALSNWVGEHGIQCIWNQYAEYALGSGKVDFAKEIMERWFHSISEFCNPESGLNTSTWISSLAQIDIVFGLLNLSLYEHLQNNHTEARVAIEQALEVASSDDYNHCVKEHAGFLLKEDFGFGKAHLRSFFNMMNRYLMDSRALASPEPLSRNFIKTIGKPKIKKFVNNLLCPVSSDSTLLNLVLESCFGPSLLTFQASGRPTDVIDLAEAVMGMKPANYRLALCICKNQSDANASVSFWASVQLIDSLLQAVPVAPESVWVEAAGLLKNLAGFRPILESFHKRALSVYPFSLRLWKSFRGLYGNDNADQLNALVKLAKEKGIKL